MLPTPKRPANVVYREGDQPDPVTPENPLEGLELDVLRVWTENSRNVRAAHQRNPAQVEAAVRRVVFDALLEEQRLRAQGLRPHEAEEFTRPQMWKPPRFG